MSGNRDSGYNSKGSESGRFGRSRYGTDPSLYSYNSPLRQTVDSPPSLRRSYLSGDREDRSRSRYDDRSRRYDEPNRYDEPKRYDNRFQRDFDDRPRSSRDFDDRPRSSRDFDDRPRTSRDFDDRPRISRDFDDRSRSSRDFDDRSRSSRDFDDRSRSSRDFDDRPRSAYSYRSDNPGSSPSTLSSSLRSRKARDDPEKSFCAMAGDYLRPSDYEGRNVHPRFQDDLGSIRKKRNAAADDLIKAVLARDAIEQDILRRRPRYSTEAHGMDSPEEEHSLHDMPLKSGLILGRPVVRDDRPYDSLPTAMHHNWDARRSAMARSASCDEAVSPEGSITPTPSMYRSFSPQSSHSSMSSYSPGPYSFCETPPTGVPPPPAYERRFLDGVPCSPTSSMPSTPSGSIPTTPTGTMPPSTKAGRVPDAPYGGSSSTPTSPNYDPGAPRFNSARTTDRKQDYDDRTTKSDSGAPHKAKKGPRKGLSGVIDSDWSDTGSLLREVLDRNFPGRIGRALFDVEDEDDQERSWNRQDDPDGISQTREKTYDLGDGRKCHVKETRSVSSPDKDRNLFDKYRFKFGSFGSFDNDDEDVAKGKDTIEFVDFDDLVRKLKQKPNVESPFNSLRKSPLRRSPVPEERKKSSLADDKRRASMPEEGRKSSHLDDKRRSSVPDDKLRRTKQKTDSKEWLPDKESGLPDKDSKHIKGSPTGAEEEDKKMLKPLEEEEESEEDEVESEEDEVKVEEESEECEKDKKKVHKQRYRDDTSPPIDLVSEEKLKQKREAERSPPLGRSKVPIPLPYKKISKETDHECDESHYNHTADCPEDCRLTCHHKCRQTVSLDCNSTAQENLEEDSQKPKKTSVKRRQSGRADDADSGYHTGESTLRDHTPGELTLTREELRKNIDAFNDNQHGLIMTLNEETATFQGFIRVHMNLMRPISMSLPSRPTSIYDVVGSDCDSDEPPCETLTTSFYLPKDTTKVIHISSATTTQDVIKALLQKFKITDNPRKFALYEKTENEGAKATMRRLVDEEKPLPLCLSWTADGLESHRFILQENEPGEIVWEAFSIPELENFLKILDREEDEYVDQMKAKYKLLRIQIERQMKTLVAEDGETQSASCTAGPPAGSHTSFEGDSREPVYV